MSYGGSRKVARCKNVAWIKQAEKGFERDTREGKDPHEFGNKRILISENLFMSA